MAAQGKQAAARGEAAGKPKRITFRGESYDLPPELPFAFALYMQEEQILNALKSLFSPDDLARLMQSGGSMGEFATFIDDLATVYGIDQGGSPASASS